ncbi:MULTISPECIES: hypothetical protein [Alkalimarinus]|uniref:Uncharacterized protein n=2 Tax=Alkalimarinus TaxID=1858563 RepID=A0A9E8HQD8_9ALTE|nr:MULTISPECIES: hypothetical protein [Alkalimarinus]UZE96920.1 hypothetical protein NKI27_03990 [Alkalimarinus alittae]UZW74621.1 hypothetical protein NNL22_16610 [Alkalimarinus sediminis]
MQHQRNLEYFVEISLGESPEFLDELTPAQVNHLREFMEHVLRREEEALVNMFKSLAMLMKYIPNMILCPMIPRYFSPSIAAMITQELSMKQIMGVISGLPVSYVGDISVYLDKELAADILKNLKKKMAIDVLSYCFETYPLKLLDVLALAPETLQKMVAKDFKQFDVDRHDLSPDRQNTYDRIVRL